MIPHRDLIDFTTGLSFQTIPDDVRAEGKRLLLDTLGCIVTARATEGGRVAEAAARALGQGVGAETYELARLADLLDLNEGYQGAHFGCGAVAAALALGRAQGATGAEILAAIVAGFETGARIVDAIGPYYTEENGKKRFAPVWGIATPVTYAAVAAAARLLRLDPGQAVEAFSMAGANSPIPVGGKWSVSVDLPNTKYGDAGWAALAGVTAALFAQGGSTGLTNLLDDDGGLLAMVGAANPTPAALSAGLGRDWRLRQVLYKDWPCCGLTFPALILLRKLMAEHGLTAGDIRAMRVGADPSILVPRFRNTDPRTQVSLQFSIPHNLALMAAGLRPGPLWQSAELAARPDIAALRACVTVAEVAPGPNAFASLELETARGTFSAALSREGFMALRSPTDDAGIAAKFRALVAAPEAGTLIAEVATLDRAATIAPLLTAFDHARTP